MGLRDLLGDTRPDADDYGRRGEQPSAHAARGLADRRIEHATRTAREGDDAHELAQRIPPVAPAPIPELTRPIGNDEWEPVYFDVPVGEVVEIVGRDELRDTFDITNQSGALLGLPCAVFLFRRETDARKMANTPAVTRAQLVRSNLRGVSLPDGAGRTLTHTAPVFAVAVDTLGNGATDAIVDVSVERRRNRPAGRDV